MDDVQRLVLEAMKLQNEEHVGKFMLVSKGWHEEIKKISRHSLLHEYLAARHNHVDHVRVLYDLNCTCDGAACTEARDKTPVTVGLQVEAFVYETHLDGVICTFVASPYAKLLVTVPATHKNIRGVLDKTLPEIYDVSRKFCMGMSVNFDEAHSTAVTEKVRVANLEDSTAPTFFRGGSFATRLGLFGSFCLYKPYCA